MKYFTAAPPAAGKRAPVQTAVVRSSWTDNFTAECDRLPDALLLIPKRFLKAGSVLHTSTKFLGCMKIFGWNFFANTYSEPAPHALSSAALVTATRVMQL